MVPNSDGRGISDGGSDASNDSEVSDTHLESLVDDIIKKAVIQQPIEKEAMTIKNRKDRTKSDHGDWDGAGPSSRHAHSYRPYGYPDERKDCCVRLRGRVSHATDTSVSRSSDIGHYQAPFPRSQPRLSQAPPENLSNPFDCRVSIREPLPSAPVVPSVDKENGNNSEDEYHGPSPNFLDHPIQADETNLEKLLVEKRGWKVIKVKADGACLFRSVAHQIFGDEEKHDLVRKQVVDYMLKNKEHFSPYITEDFDHYVDRKRDAACYGNHVEIQAIAELYNRPVEIYHDSVEPINVFHAEYSKEFPIRLSYHGHVHYNSVVDPFKPSFGHGLGMPNYQPSLTESDLIAKAIHESEVTQLEETMLHDKIAETEQLDIDRCIEAEVVRESYFDYLNQLKLPMHRIGSPNNQLSLSSVARTPSPPVLNSVDVASSSNAMRYNSLRSAQPHQRSPPAIPSSSQQQYPPGMDDDSIIAMVLEQSRLEYLESLKKRRSPQSFDSYEPQISVHTASESTSSTGAANERSSSLSKTAF